MKVLVFTKCKCNKINIHEWLQLAVSNRYKKVFEQIYFKVFGFISNTFSNSSKLFGFFSETFWKYLDLLQILLKVFDPPLHDTIQSVDGR